jgi:mRNA interferase RelE/StbE
VPFSIIWSKKAIRSLKRMERPIAKRVYDAVSALKADPFKCDVIKLTNAPWYRLRVGDRRVILDINKGQLRILAIMIGHRKNIYERRIAPYGQKRL